MGGACYADNLHCRFATFDDLEDITAVAQQGFPDDPEFDYRFPKRTEFPGDNRSWIRKEYEEYLEQTEKFAVLVVTAPIKLENEESRKSISLAVWDLSVETQSKGGDLGLDVRRDVNKAHYLQFAKVLEQAKEQHFASRGKEQYHLWLLTTHPDFRRRGAATMLCKWGMEKAAEKKYAVTVLGSSMGKSLYEHLGFRLLGSVTVQVIGEDETLIVYCLEYLGGNTPANNNPLYLILDGVKWLSGLPFLSALRSRP